MARTPGKRTTPPTGKNKPQGERVFSIETANGNVGLVKSKTAEDVAETLLAAKQAGGFAVFKRVDGETLIINPEMVYLVGQVEPQ